MERALTKAPIDPLALLRATDIFAGLSPELLADSARGMTWSHLLGGDVLFRQGEVGDALYLVVSGRLRAVAEGEDGGARVLREIGRGEKVGELALLTDEPRSATVQAVRDTTLARFSRDLFHDLVTRHPAAVLPLTRALASHLRRAHVPAAGGAIASTIAVIPLHRDLRVEALAEDLADSLSSHGRTRRVDVDFVQRHMPNDAVHGDDAHPGHGRLSAWLDELEIQHRHLVYQGDLSSPLWTRRCIREADRTVFVAAAGADRREASQTMNRILRGLPADGARQELVLLHDDGATPAGTAAWLALHPFAAHHHVRLGNSQDVARLGRRLTGASVGVVLSGGAARGFAHIGVLRALEEAGVPVDQIGGSSMGSVIGAQYAGGCSPDAMLELNRLWEKHSPLRDLTLPVIALISGTSGRVVLQEMFGDRCIEDLWLDYFCVSANLTRSRIVVHRQGSVFQWVRSSVAIPGIVPPLRIENGDLLVDGGVLNNMPADVMRDLGAGRVIAVDVTPPEELPTEDYEDQPSTWQQLRLLRSSILPLGTPLRSPTIFTILYRTMLVGSRSLSERLKSEVDLYIAPAVGRFGLFEWNSLERIAEIGYREARRRLAAWTGGGAETHPPAVTDDAVELERPVRVSASRRLGTRRAAAIKELR